MGGKMKENKKGEVKEFGEMTLMKFKDPPVWYIGREVCDDLMPFILSKNVFYYFPQLMNVPLLLILLFAVSGGELNDN
jgi:hypothetical protein